MRAPCVTGKVGDGTSISTNRSPALWSTPSSLSSTWRVPATRRVGATGRRCRRRSHRAVRRRAGGNRAAPRRSRARAPPGRWAVAEPELAVLDRDRHDARLADEAEDEGRVRRVVDVVGRADLLDPALAHDDHAVGELQRLFLVVGHEDRGVAGGVVDFAQPAAQVPSAPAHRARRTARRAAARAARWPGRGPAPRAGAGRRKAASGSASRGRELHQIEQLHGAAADLRPRRAHGRPAAPSGRRRYCRAPSCGGTAHSAGTRSRHCAPARCDATHPRRRRRSCPLVGCSSPAISRSSVVLPEPEGPSSAISSPERMSSETSCSAGKRANSLRTL